MEFRRVTDLKGLLDRANQAYDSVRIIEITKRQIVHNESNKDITYESIYCGSWEQSEYICPDCFQDCDLIDENTLVRFEDSGERKLMIITKPFIFGDDKYILEMVKDRTEAKKESN